MYEVNGRIRYSETDSKGQLTYPALLNYFRDSSIFHSASLGAGADYTEEKNLAWILTSWQICIERMPKSGDEIITQTWSHKMQGFFGYRNFCMVTPEGERLAYANSIWVLINSTTGRPTRVPDSIKEMYPQEPPIAMECCDRKISVPFEYEEKEPIPVLKYFIDTNQHVNNEKYVMLAQEFLPEDYDLGEIRVEYRKAAVLNDILYPRVTVAEDRVTVMLGDEKGNPYAIVLFLKRNNI